MKTISKNGISITYEVIRKPNKNAYFRVRDGMLIVTCHPKTSITKIETFIDSKFDVFYKKIDESLHLESDHHVMLWGKSYEIIWTEGQFKYEVNLDHITIRTKHQDHKHDKKRLYAKELEKMLSELIPKINLVIEKEGIKPLPMNIKYLKSKFGSYHRLHHEITLNSFLARLDPIYLEYVIYHEYAHVLVFNHSKDFYNLLDKLMPNHKVYQKDLKKIAIT